MMKHIRQCHPEQEHSCLACGQVTCMRLNFGINLFVFLKINFQATSSKAELCQHIDQHTDAGPAYLACERFVKLPYMENGVMPFLIYDFFKFDLCPVVVVIMKFLRCGKICMSQYQLQQHKRTHNAKQLGSMACPHCDRTFQVVNAVGLGGYSVVDINTSAI